MPKMRFLPIDPEKAIAFHLVNYSFVSIFVEAKVRIIIDVAK